MTTFSVHDGVLAGRAGTIGVVSPVLGGYYFGRVLAGATRVLHAGRHKVVAVQTYPADLDRAEFPVAPRRRTLVGTARFDGVIVVTTALDNAAIRRIDAEGTPLVLVGVGPVDDVAAPRVGPDNAGAVRAAVDHLVAHGHRRIGFLGNTTQADTHERLVAYRQALVAHGIEPCTDWLYRTRDNQEASAQAVASRLVERDGGLLATTATLAATDRNAVGFMRGLRAEGLQLPDAQAVIGIDHSDLGARIRPRLSSVDLMHDTVGERAAQTLLAMLHGGEVTGEHRLARSTLVLRESCGCDVGAHGEVVAGSKGTPGPKGTPGRTPLVDLGRKTDRAAAATPAATGAESAPQEPGLEAIASVVFGQADGREAWVAAVRRILTAAADHGLRARAAALRSLAEATARLRPAPDALEQLVPAVHAEAAARRRRRATPFAPGSPGTAARRTALEAMVRDVVVALARGTVAAALGRAGRLEAELLEQYEVDLELMRADGAALRGLDWLPRGNDRQAALALWVDDPHAAGGRALQVVGVRGSAAGADRLIGASYPPEEFPPPELTDPRWPTLIIPVGFGSSDRGVLLVSALVDSRATSTRARYNHWAAMLAVALDAEETLTALQLQRRELADAAERERGLALEVAAGNERTALASIASLDGTWDWDVEAGRVRYSEAWARIVGCDPELVGDDPQEWFGRVHPEDARKVQSAVAAQLSGAHRPFDVEHRLRKVDGRYVVVRCRAVTVHDAGGRVARMVGAMAVVTPTATFRDEPRDRGPAVAETGLVSRDVFVERLARAMHRGRRVAAYRWQLLVVRFAAPPSPAVLRRLSGELGEIDCAHGPTPLDVVVLLDGLDMVRARRCVARLQRVLGHTAVVEHCSDRSTSGSRDDAAAVLRRAGGPPVAGRLTDTLMRT